MNSVERRNFFEYLCKQKTESDFTTNLADKVKSVKTSSDEKRVYMTFEEMVEVRREEAKEEGRAEGIEKGREETRLETARNMFELNLSPAQIAKCTGLPLEKVLELQNEVVKVVTE